MAEKTAGEVTGVYTEVGLKAWPAAAKAAVAAVAQHKHGAGPYSSNRAAAACASARYRQCRCYARRIAAPAHATRSSATRAKIPPCYHATRIARRYNGKSCPSQTNPPRCRSDAVITTKRSSAEFAVTRRRQFGTVRPNATNWRTATANAEVARRPLWWQALSEVRSHAAPQTRNSTRVSA